jgi:hypothetical protein
MNSPEGRPNTPETYAAGVKDAASQAELGKMSAPDGTIVTYHSEAEKQELLNSFREEGKK